MADRGNTSTVPIEMRPRAVENEMTSPGHYSVERPEPGVAVVVLVGEHDLTTSAELRVILEELGQEGRSVVIDISPATFVDSAILNSVYQFAARQREEGRTLVLQASTAAIVRRAFEIVGMFDQLPSAPERDDAVRLARV